jgi:membrane-bound inhibitor of C-type lysozyme
MNCRKITIIGAALGVAAAATAPTAAYAQSRFQNYRCADGAQFIVGFFQYDSRAHLQLDGKAVTLIKRVSLSGSRYSGRGVTLKITRAGVTTLKHAKRPVTTCDLT